MDGPVRIGILTISDRVAAGVYADRGGPAVQAALAAGLAGRVGAGRPHGDRRLDAIADAPRGARRPRRVRTGRHDRWDGAGAARRHSEATRGGVRPGAAGFGEAMRAASFATRRLPRSHARPPACAGVPDRQRPRIRRAVPPSVSGSCSPRRCIASPWSAVRRWCCRTGSSAARVGAECEDPASPMKSW